MWKLRQPGKIVGVFLIRVFNKTAKAVLFGCFKSSLRRSRNNEVNTFFAAKAACHTYGTIKWQQAILSKNKYYSRIQSVSRNALADWQMISPICEET